MLIFGIYIWEWKIVLIPKKNGWNNRRNIFVNDDFFVRHWNIFESKLLILLNISILGYVGNMILEFLENLRKIEWLNKYWRPRK